MVKKQSSGGIGSVLRTGIFSILCMGLAIGGEGMATQVAAKHLKDYEWLRKASGEEDAIALLRMQSEYQSMVRGEVDDIWATSYAEEISLREQAYDLAESRYKQGLGTVRDVYETGIELYDCIRTYEEGRDLWMAMRPNSAPIPPARECPISLEQLKALRQTVSAAAQASGNRLDWLNAEILWYTHMEVDCTKDRAYKAELADLLRKRYQQGFASRWEVALAELNLQQAMIYQPPVETVLQRWDEYIKAMADLYCQLEQIAKSGSGGDGRVYEQLFRLRLQQKQAEMTRHVLEKLPSAIENAVERYSK